MIQEYLILLCLESLVLKHLRLPYPCCFIWREKFWSHLLPCIGTNQVSIFCLGFLVTKFLVEFNMYGKAKKDGKAKNAFGKKRTCNTIVVSFNFLLKLRVY